MSIRVSVLEASGLPAAYSHNLFCQYKFWGQEDALIIPPLLNAGSHDIIAPPVGVHQFQHSQVFSVDVTEDFLEYLQEGSLAVEVWGHRRSGFVDNVQSESGNHGDGNMNIINRYMYSVNIFGWKNWQILCKLLLLMLGLSIVAYSI